MWGTIIGVDVRDAVEPALIDDVFAWFRRVDDLFSTWRADSEVSRLGAGDLTLAQTSPDVRQVLDLCDELSRLSCGAFDISVGADPRVAPAPGRGPIDPSGLVKGWALDRAGQLLRAAGTRNFSLNAGGDILVGGRPRPGGEWQVGIQHPWRRDRVAAVVACVDLGVATSGRYERGEHIVDPRTGRHPNGLMAVTVIAEELWLADGCATAAVVLGADALGWLEDVGGVEGLVIADTRRVQFTSGFDRHRRS